MVIHRRIAFTLVELLMVMGMISILATILMPTIGRIRESARRTGCGASLAAIGRGVQQYAGQNKGAIPWFTEASADSSYLGKNCKNASAVSDGNTRQWFNLVKGPIFFAKIDHFICPSDTRVKANAPCPSTNVDFPADPGGPTISFSLAMTKVNPPNGVRPSWGDSGELAIAADHNGAAPWSWDGSAKAWKAVLDTSKAKTNSPNHEPDGQNVLFRGGDVNWTDTPICGAPEEKADGTLGPDDNIWTSQSGSYPRNEKDSFLRP